MSARLVELALEWRKLKRQEQVARERRNIVEQELLSMIEQKPKVGTVKLLDSPVEMKVAFNVKAKGDFKMLRDNLPKESKQLLVVEKYDFSKTGLAIARRSLKGVALERTEAALAAFVEWPDEKPAFTVR